MSSSSSSRGRWPVAIVQAHVPSRSVLVGKQITYFRTPASIENTFELCRGDKIRPDYVSQLNNLLANVAMFCETARGGMYDCLICDVLRLNISFRETSMLLNGHHILKLNLIVVRPCFERNGMLSIILYQLLLTALIRGDVAKVIVEDCVERTVDIIVSKFGDLVNVVSSDASGQSKTYCEFSDLEAVADRVSMASLRIEHRIANEEFGILTLRPDAFPTAEQLNDPAWVEAHVGAGA